MNWVDYTIIAVLALSVLVGLWRGLISEVLALVIWIAAFWVAWLFGARVADAFAGAIRLPQARVALGYVTCFVLVLIVGALVRFGVNKLIETTGLSGSDRMFGMLFGLARGLLIVTFAVLLIGFTALPTQHWWQRSRLLPSFEPAAQWLSTWLPHDVSRYVAYAPAVVKRASAALGTASTAAGLPLPTPDPPRSAASMAGPAPAHSTD